MLVVDVVGEQELGQVPALDQEGDLPHPLAVVGQVEGAIVGIVGGLEPEEDEVDDLQRPRVPRSSNASALSGERDRLDGDENAGDVGPEADHHPRRLRPGEELRVRLVHFPVEVGPCEQHGDLHRAVERAPGGFEDGLDVAQGLTGLPKASLTSEVHGSFRGA